MSKFDKRIAQMTKIKPKLILLHDDPNDSWAQVELYRWQYGELPPQDNSCKKLKVSEGLKGMATAIETGDVKNFPSPMNVVSVLRYAAKLLEESHV